MITVKYEEFSGRILGSFACDCGFTYRRPGPDKSPEDRWRVGRVVSYGPVYRDGFQQVWNSTDIPRSEAIKHLAEQMNLSTCGVRYRAQQLGLSTKFVEGKIHVHNEFSSETIDDITKLEQITFHHQAVWLMALEEHGDRGIRFFQENYWDTYYWLVKNNPDWFREHKPPKKQQMTKLQPTDSYINWADEDIHLAEQIQLSVTSIRNQNPPTRVTKQAIIRTIDKGRWIKNPNSKIPLTTKMLKASVETPADFVIRKIWYTMELYISEQKVPFRIPFMIRAGARNLAHLPEVSAAINAALQQLQAPPSN